MARKRSSVGRRALALAFSAGAVTGAVSMLTLRRRGGDAGTFEEDVRGPFREHVVGPLGEAVAPPLGGKINAPSGSSSSMAAATHG
ncbi:hypothetical protein [Micromonospora sp. C28ISP2-4]|uniref:hypothetical protein n=1 Tax=Micromonospora sp. C28ISP2-4 TaxID=3059523 RepID=UPI0026772A81|nr:hypothetical protein [Micromonospora sp. C28ISP2-4]MDO3683254.1 hypothetical protein [Micromonospora sp. C28ISP2-4]